MKFHNALPWLPALLVLGGCPSSEKPQLRAIAVTCAPNPLVVGGTARCTASATDQNGDDFTVSGYTWSSSDETVAKLDAEGTATSVTLGTTTVTASATADGVTQQGQASLSIIQKPPTLHATPITANETWSVADNPHVVRGQVPVDNGATLTLEAGVDVRFEQDAELRIRDGQLLAPGTAQAPIQLAADNSSTPGFWRGMVLATDKSVSRLSHVSLSHCGNSAGEGACLAVLNKAAPVLQYVSVRGSGSAGVKVADDGSAFGADSARLTVTGSAGYAVRLGANQASTLPQESTFTDNASNVIELTGDVSSTQTWRPQSVPYVLNGNVNVSGIDSSTSVTLSLTAGTQLRFGANAEFNVGAGQGPGNVLVEGTAAAPVLFTADSDSSKPGHWKGVHVILREKASRISHAIFEYAGAGGHSLQLEGTGNLNFYGDARSPFAVVSDVIVRKSSGPGLYATSAGFGSGSGKLTVSDNGKYAMRIGADDLWSLPRDTAFIGNTPNAVDLHGNVITSQTWSKFSVPLVITGVTDVGYWSGNTVLTLAPGLELKFARGAALTIGSVAGRTGSLVAVGTESAPIHFVPDVSTAELGYWYGLHFWKAQGSKLDYVRVSNGGLPYDGVPSESVIGDGNVNVYREIGAFISNSAFSYAPGCAIRGADGFREGTTEVTSRFFDTVYKNTASSSGINRQCAF
ncbi:hypothetical protein F0U62_34760 [Cystobacter fuscus]|uniref:hypothetical protein n=1 Tax=Cystobacter fuscus TaxID=43 RepID=UPI002B30E198|nr:hypothetical protein F0U62_34760 [Cystobacter fuscus]